MVLNRQEVCNQRQEESGEECLDKHTPRLPTYLHEFRLILNLFFLLTKFSRTARSKRHSGFVFCLKVANCRSPKQK